MSDILDRLNVISSRVLNREAVPTGRKLTLPTEITRSETYDIAAALSDARFEIMRLRDSQSTSTGLETESGAVTS
jgi:hypothetical protein